ncbi:MAG TPA: inorganic diphosphatase, partial [Cystobacter sp.]
MATKNPPTHTFQAHPWHGISPGENAPESVTAYIEIVPTDTVKYELDKEAGILRLDRPQRFSSQCPTLYGFIPRTYCDELVAKRCAERSGHKDIKGDGDPLDICVLTEKVIPAGALLVRAVPVGGFRMVDGNEADDKIIAVL